MRRDNSIIKEGEGKERKWELQSEGEGDGEGDPICYFFVFSSFFFLFDLNNALPIIIFCSFVRLSSFTFVSV